MFDIAAKRIDSSKTQYKLSWASILKLGYEWSSLEKLTTHNEEEVLIKRKDGSLYTFKPALPNDSPLDVQGIDINISANEIVDIIKEVRRR